MKGGGSQLPGTHTPEINVALNMGDSRSEGRSRAQGLLFLPSTHDTWSREAKDHFHTIPHASKRDFFFFIFFVALSTSPGSDTQNCPCLNTRDLYHLITETSRGHHGASRPARLPHRET